MHSGRASRGKALDDIDGVIGDLLAGFEVALTEADSLPAH
jgi:hypothetical protein